MLKNLLKQRVAKCLLLFALLLGSWTTMSAFDGSDLTNGKNYYLFNIYQSKFLGAENKLQAPNIGSPVAFTASNGGFTIGGTAYTATKNSEGYYQLKNGNQFFAFEDKVADPNDPTDENRAMYLRGGVTCQNTTNDTDRGYWQLISEDEYAEWLAKKKFTVSSLNVDGMPKSVSLVVEIKLNPDATEGPGATQIGKRVAASGFDVIGLSEDFNYHSNIMAEISGTGYKDMTHRGGISVGEANLLNFVSQKPLFDSDGLGLLYKTPHMQTPANETFVQWNQHNGYTDQGADGLIKKGYRYYLLTLEDGTQIDLYTMHMDADDGQGDRDARASQLTQIANAIKATNNKRPIVIIGDSNTRYTRDKVKTNLIDAINADERFTIRDPWIQFGRDGKYPAYPSNSIMAKDEGYRKGEVVDKIWYINNKESNIRLVAETYAQDLSFVASEDVEGTNLKKGSPLCDHKPCVVTFSYHEYVEGEDTYNPADEKEENNNVYLRNRQTGRFLKSGGNWGTHTVVGNYPIGFEMISNGDTYALKSGAGYLKVGSDGQPYIDGNDNEAITDWVKTYVDGDFVTLTHNGLALSATESTAFNDDPNYWWANFSEEDVTDKLQQWEVLTKDQMMEELQKANAKNPVNASWLMSNPNFDRNLTTAIWNNNISSSATRMTSNLAGENSGLNEGGANDNLCAEAYVKNCTDWEISCKHATTWDINQVLTGVPNGWYRVSAQAFQRISNNNTTTADIELYANGVAQKVELMYNLKEITTAGFGSKKDGNYYYPDNMSEASQYFLKGYYQNSVWVNVTDGTLKVGIRKTSDTGKNNTAWCCFDNFQLYYFGAEKPTEDLGVNVIAETRKAEMINGALTLTGTWREENMDELSTKIETNKPLLLDASANNFLICRPEIVTASAPANMMIKVADANDVANTQNVIAEGQCANFVLTDLKDFAPQQGFTALDVTYTRTNTKGYNTVCMPFDTTVEDYPGCVVFGYTQTNTDPNTIRFTEIAEDITITAGTPVLVYSESGNDWEMNLVGRNVVAGAGNNGPLYGSFLEENIGAGCYKLDSKGTAFYKTSGNGMTYPFRFYVKTESTASSLRIIFDDEETGLEEILNSEDTTVEQTYDISGRRVINITHPGIYIIGGKKVFIK